MTCCFRTCRWLATWLSRSRQLCTPSASGALELLFAHTLAELMRLPT
jgi:hypothetical protein